MFLCPGTYFGRYCSDEREFEYARILERDNKETMKLLDSIKSPEESEVCIEIDKLLKELKEKGLVSNIDI